MSIDWASDIFDMHEFYGFGRRVREMDASKLRALLEFRKGFLQEEMRELETAESAEDVVDALIDLCVVAIGTLDLFEVDAWLAWDSVHQANMAKQVGVKESRPNPLGLPDLVKPEGWQSPDHGGNTGLLDEVFEAAAEKEPAE